MRGLFKIMLVGVITLGIIYTIISWISTVFTNDLTSKKINDICVIRALNDSKCKWNNTLTDFYSGRKLVYVARQANINEYEVLKREVLLLKEDQKRISKIDLSGINDESSMRSLSKIINYINNANNELILALESSDGEKYIINANKEIQLANNIIDKLSDEYNIDRQLLNLVELKIK